MSKPRNRNKIIAAVVVAVVAAVVVSTWKPWHTAKASLPSSACWGILSGEDLRPLAGKDGAATAWIVGRGGEVPGTMKSPEGENDGPTWCDIRWNGKSIASADIGAADDGPINAAKSQPDSRLHPITLSPGVFLLPGFDDVHIYFRCDGLQPNSTYAVAGASAFNGGVNQTSYASASELNAYAKIALKFAKAAASQLPCTNRPTFPVSVPWLTPAS